MIIDYLFVKILVSSSLLKNSSGRFSRFLIVSAGRKPYFKIVSRNFFRFLEIISIFLARIHSLLSLLEGSRRFWNNHQ